LKHAVYNYNIIYYYVYYIILWDHRRICGPSLTETSLCGAYLYLVPMFRMSGAILPLLLCNIQGLLFTIWYIVQL